MTALVGQDVKRTFSAHSAKFTGLPRCNTHEAGRQDLGEFGEALLWRALGVVEFGNHPLKLTQFFPKSSRGKVLPELVVQQREQKQTIENYACE